MHQTKRRGTTLGRTAQYTQVSSINFRRVHALLWFVFNLYMLAAVMILLLFHSIIKPRHVLFRSAERAVSSTRAELQRVSEETTSISRKIIFIWSRLPNQFTIPRYEHQHSERFSRTTENIITSHALWSTFEILLHVSYSPECYSAESSSSDKSLTLSYYPRTIRPKSNC